MGKESFGLLPSPLAAGEVQAGGCRWSVLVHLCLCRGGSQAHLGAKPSCAEGAGGHSWKWLLDGASVFPGIQPEPCIAVTRELLADWPEVPHPLPVVTMLGHYSSDIRSPADPAGH